MLSVCIITKNEAEKLNRCLQSLSSYPVEIIVVDTGSTDESKKVAKKYTDSVYDFEWVDDFSAARNYAIQQATQPYILTLDTDEYIVSMDYEECIRVIQEHFQQLGKIELINTYERNGNQISEVRALSRVFHKEYYKYQGMVHEQLTFIQQVDMVQQTYNVPIRIIHDGYNYSMEYLTAKADRNIRLLKKELENQMETSPDPYILFQLGKSFAMKQDYRNADFYFEQATSIDLNPQLEWVQNLILSYGYNLLNLKEYEKALGLEGLREDIGFIADYNFLMGLIYMNNEMFEMAIQNFVMATQHTIFFVEGTQSYKAWYNIGVIYECLGRKEQALEYYHKCGAYDKAMARRFELMNG